MLTTARPGRRQLVSVSYAKNRAHEQFLLRARGELRGRYILALLIGVGNLGGIPLRLQIEEEVGRALYLPDLMYPARELVLICHYAHAAGVPLARLGETLAPTFRRAHPEAFSDCSMEHICAIIENAYREETTCSSVSAVDYAIPGFARIFRRNQPAPCAFVEGVLKGFLSVMNASGTAEEVACQWQHGASCTYELHWRT
jgi:hypothetical protein